MFSDGGPTPERHNKFYHFTDVLKLLLVRWKAERDPLSVVSIEETYGDLESVRTVEYTVNHAEGENAVSIYNRQHDKDRTKDEMEEENFERLVTGLDIPSNVQATYKEKFMVDIVDLKNRR